jgi:hypothetical protein
VEGLTEGEVVGPPPPPLPGDLLLVEGLRAEGPPARGVPLALGLNILLRAAGDMGEPNNDLRAPGVILLGD